MRNTLATDVLEPDLAEPRRIRVRHGIASPLDLLISPAQAERLTGCGTIGEALEILLSAPGVDPRFAAACRKTLDGPCVVELLSPTGPAVGTPRMPLGGRLGSFPVEIGFSKAVRGGSRQPPASR